MDIYHAAELGLEEIYIRAAISYSQPEGKECCDKWN
jgi:hypothetical protein